MIGVKYTHFFITKQKKKSPIVSSERLVSTPSANTRRPILAKHKTHAQRLPRPHFVSSHSHAKISVVDKTPALLQVVVDKTHELLPVFPVSCVSDSTFQVKELYAENMNVLGELTSEDVKKVFTRLEESLREEFAYYKIVNDPNQNTFAMVSSGCWTVCCCTDP